MLAGTPVVRARLARWGSSPRANAYPPSLNAKAITTASVSPVRMAARRQVVRSSEMSPTTIATPSADNEPLVVDQVPAHKPTWRRGQPQVAVEPVGMGKADKCVYADPVSSGGRGVAPGGGVPP